jgi:hypothetical protein
MKSFTSFFQLFAFVVLCFATTVANAQVNAMAGFYTTNGAYTYSSTDGMGSRAVVALVKPTTNQIRVSTYDVAANGTVTLKDYYDYASATIVKVAMLTPTRVIVARANPNGSHVATAFDIDANGNLTKKGEWSGFIPNFANFAITRLSNESFATAFRTDTGMRMVSFSVPSNGNVVKKTHLDIDGGEGEVDLARLTDTRLVAAVKISQSYVKFTCFDVAPLTLAITQKGHLGWNNEVSKLSLATFSDQRFAIFAIDANSRLDAMSLNVNAAGSVTLADAKLDVKKPGTSDYLLLKDLDAQTISTSPGKILLSSIRTNDNLTVIPFSLTNGVIAAQSGGYYPNAPNVTQVSAGFITGNMMVGSFRQVEDGKYHIRSYKWN